MGLFLFVCVELMCVYFLLNRHTHKNVQPVQTRVLQDNNGGPAGEKHVFFANVPTTCRIVGRMESGRCALWSALQEKLTEGKIRRNPCR